MKKRLLAFGLAGILVLASSMTAFAEDRQGAAGWQVGFDGSRLSSNFTNANMDDEIYNMQPGDSVELTISLKNDYNGQADWYMKNQVLQTLEDAGNAAGGAYDYLLTYTDKDGTVTTLYSSEKFGGEGRINGVGLHGATTSLEDYFYLDRMGNGDTGIVKLKVALEPETQGNAYQNTLARLQMDFATELVSGAGTTPGTNLDTNPGSDPDSNPGTGGNVGGHVAKTGDESQVMLYVLLAFSSGFVLLIAAIVRLHRDREEKAAAVSVRADAGEEVPQAGRRRRR